jgi:hypothetical protein
VGKMNKKLKVAVCLHGESRTWEKVVPSLRHFFEADDAFDIHYFGHTWTRNSWKVFDQIHMGGYAYEDLDRQPLYDNMISKFPFRKLVIDEPLSIDISSITKEIQKEEVGGFETASNYKKPWTWNSMSYSSMMSNFLKQEYEIDHSVKFDLVVSTRFDCCLSPNYRLVHYMPPIIEEYNLYTEVTHNPHEFMQRTVNDVFYMGTSLTMDIIENFYRVYYSGAFFDMHEAGYYDGALKNVGYGVLLYKWAVMKNIHPNHVGHLHWSILRQNTKVVDTINEYPEIIKESYTWGRIE